MHTIKYYDKVSREHISIRLSSQQGAGFARWLGVQKAMGLIEQIRTYPPLRVPCVRLASSNRHCRVIVYQHAGGRREAVRAHDEIGKARLQAVGCVEIAQFNLPHRVKQLWDQSAKWVMDTYELPHPVGRHDHGVHWVTYATLASTDGRKSCYGVFRCKLYVLPGREPFVLTAMGDRVSTFEVVDGEPDYYKMAQACETPGWPAFAWDNTW